MKILLTWPVTITSSNNALWVVAKGIGQLLTITPGDYAGISYSGVGMGVGSDSLAQAFCDMMATHAHVSSCSAVYDFSPSVGTAHPATVYALAYTHQAGDQLEFAHGSSTFPASTLGGVDGTDYPLATSMTNPQNSAGYWCPITGADNCADIRDLEIIGSESSAASATADAGFSTRKLGEPVRGRLLYDYVDSAYIRLSDALDTVSALPDIAHRTAGDTHNLLERVIVAAGDNRPIQVYRGQEHRFQCRLRKPWGIRDIATAMGSSGVRWTVTLNHTVTV